MAFTIAMCACGGSPRHPRPATLPSAEMLVGELAKLERARNTFIAKDVQLDYRDAKQRVNVTVRIAGTRSHQLRFNVVRPDGTEAKELGCDGAELTFVDHDRNCKRVGQCDRRAVQEQLRLDLDPQDFVAFALATTPVLANAERSVTWNDRTGRVRLVLASSEATQSIELDARGAAWDVAKSELVGRDGKTRWSVENHDFVEVRDGSGAAHRLPRRTQLLSPTTDGDAIVTWNERAINGNVAAATFRVDLPGVADCP